MKELITFIVYMYVFIILFTLSGIIVYIYNYWREYSFHKQNRMTDLPKILEDI